MSCGRMDGQGRPTASGRRTEIADEFYRPCGGARAEAFGGENMPAARGLPGGFRTPSGRSRGPFLGAERSGQAPPSVKIIGFGAAEADSRRKIRIFVE